MRYIRNRPMLEAISLAAALAMAAPGLPGAAASAASDASAGTPADTARARLHPPADAQVRALVREALERNPDLRSVRLEAEAAHAEADAQRGLEPPQIGVEFHETPLASFPNPARGGMETDYFLQQTIPFPGKRKARAEAGRFRGNAGDERARAAADALARDVKTAYYGLCLADERLAANGETRSLAVRLIEAARVRYENGTGSQADILRAQAELSMLRSEAIGLDEARQGAETTLNLLLDRPADRPFGPAGALSPAPVPWTYPHLKALAASRHPSLKAMDAEIAMRGAELSASRRDFLPDLMIKGSYMDMQGVPAGAHAAPGDAWSLMLGVDVPVAPWSLPRYRSGYRAARTGLERAALGRKAAANRVDAEVRTALAKADAAWRQWELSGDALVPQAEQALNASLSAYRAGSGDFASLLGAYRASLSARLERHAAAARLMQSRSELERALGMDLDSIPQETPPGGKS